MVHPDFFDENGGRNLHHSDSENWWLEVVASDEYTCDQNSKPSTLAIFSPILSLLSLLAINSRFRSSSAIMDFTKHNSLGGQVGFWPLVFTSENCLFVRISKFLNLQVCNVFWDNLVRNSFYDFYDYLYWLIWPRSEFGRLTGYDFSLFILANLDLKLSILRIYHNWIAILFLIFLLESNMSLTTYEVFLEFSGKQLTDYLSVRAWL